ncbi:MAG TPA: substrate-binding domain-containing protein [Pirellulales bacterium]|jgi:ribose transport system substrate-binding protein|nr:substrate-binding domain-containing protein [Pirellulales bacterium]
MWRNLLVLLSLAILVGCSDEAAGPGGQGASVAMGGNGKKYQIAVVPKAATHEFWKSVHAGAEDAASELGNVEIIWKAPAEDDNRNQQIDLVENFVTRGVNGICLAPIDSQALVNVAKDVKAANIPLVIFDSGLNDPSLYVSYVATDNENGGRLAAREMGRQLNGKGNVLLLRYSSGSESTENRERGFLETIKKEFPDIKILSSDQYAGTSEQTALDKSQQLLLKYGKEVNGIFAVNESSAAGMLQALKEAGLTGKVVYLGFDSSNRIVKALRDGDMQGVVLQDPVNMGYQAVKAIVAQLTGQPVEKRVSTGEAVATKENMDNPHMHKLLNPEQF